MNVYVAETMEHPETGHWTLTGDSAPGHRGSCWSQKHPAAEMGQKEMQVHDLSYIFLCFPIFSYHYASLCFTVTSTQQSSAPIGGRFFPPNRSPFRSRKEHWHNAVMKETWGVPSSWEPMSLHHCKWFCGCSQDSKICHCN